MNAKEFLSQAFYMNRQIKSKQKRLDVLRDINPGPSMVFSDEVKIPRDPKRSAVEICAIRIADLEEEIEKDILDFVDVVKAINEVIRRIDNIEYRTILEMRYLAFMDWTEITDRMGYSIRQTFYLHRRALEVVHVPNA